MAVPEWFPQWAKPEPKYRKPLLGSLAVLIVVGVSAFSLFFRSHNPVFGWEGTYEPDWRLDIQGMNGAVSSDTALCSQMGVDVLKMGGSAADAAVQVCLCIGSMDPQSSGIGGGGFITVRFPNGTSLVIDARETAPAGSHKYMFDDDPMKSKVLGLASGVPGELAGLQTLWEMGGRLPWAELVDPVAELNEKGFPRGEAVGRITEIYKSRINDIDPGLFDKLLKASDWCWLFYDHPQCVGSSPSSAETIKRPHLAKTLRKIAHEGVDAFYHGPIAQSMVDTIQKTGGILTMEDLANYSVIVRPSLTTTFLNRTVITAPEPASGPALIMGLHAIEQLLPELSEDDIGENRKLDQDPVMLHRIVEVMKWMAAARSELGDPDFISNPKIAKIVEKEWADFVVGNISDSHTLPSWRDYHPSYEMNNPSGTTHFSVVDENGMAVSVTSTVNLPFGNFVCDPKTGIVMNSEMDDFSTPHQRNGFELAPSIYNFVEPGKRPLSSTVPSVFVSPEGTVELVIGAAGGSRILTTVFLAILRVYGFDLEPLEAVAFPRFHHQLIPENISIEPGLGLDLISEWEKRGHEVQEFIPASVMNLIHRDADGVLHAIGDFYRKRGIGAAY